MTNRTIMKIIGFSLTLSGSEIVLFGNSDYRGFMIPDWTGYPILLTGLGTLVFGFVATKKQTGDEVGYLICPSCLHVVEPSPVKPKSCPKCGGTLEPLKGFYDRHPELADASGNDSSKGGTEKTN